MIEALGPLGILGAIVVLIVSFGIAYLMRQFGITASISSSPSTTRPSLRRSLSTIVTWLASASTMEASETPGPDE